MKPTLEKPSSNGKANINHDFDFSQLQNQVKEIIEEFPEGEVTGEQLLKMEVKEIQYLLQDLLPKTGLAALAGPSDTGKSMFLRNLAISLVKGESKFVGFQFKTRYKSCIYVSSEDGDEATAVLMQRQASKCLPENMQGLRFIFDFENLYKKLDSCLTAKPADLIIIDCFLDVFDGDLKDTQKIRTYLNSYQKLSEKHKCLILFVHHTGKRTENLEPSKNNLLSGQGFEAKMRLVMELRMDKYDLNHRHLCIVKGNYLPDSSKRESFVLKFHNKDFNFSYTGERIPFNLLAKEPSSENSRMMYDQIMALKEKGYTHQKTAEELGIGSKGTVTKILAKGKENGWDKVSGSVSSGNEGNEKGNEG